MHEVDVRPTEEQVRSLYAAQEVLYRAIAEKICDCDIRLIGGTALSRCYLGHRISFDLDFSLDPAKRYDATLFERVKEISGVHLLNSNAWQQDVYAFSFYEFVRDGLHVEFSIGEDRMFRHYEPEVRRMGATQVNTVTLETLYLNKLRAIAGDMPGFGRQKLRDVFDILALSKEYCPLGDFAKQVEQKMPSFDQDRLFESLAVMPWHALAAEHVYAIGKWREFESIDALSDALYAEAGMEVADDNV